MSRAPYRADRVRQLRIVTWVILVLTGLSLAYAGFLLVDGTNPAVRVLVLLVLPGVLAVGLAVWSLRLLAHEASAARWTLTGAGVFSTLLGLVLSQFGPAIVFSVAGILVILLALLPARQEPA